MDKCSYKYCKKNKHFFIKISGRATYDFCDGFKDFVDKVIDENLSDAVLIDLSETEYLDSTNLGLLAKIAVYQLENYQSKATILSTEENITQLIINTGLEQIFNIINVDNNQTSEWTNIMSKQFDDSKKLSKTLLETHEILMNLNDKNKSEFKDVVNLLKTKNTE